MCLSEKKLSLLRISIAATMNNNWKLGSVLFGQAVFSVLFLEYFTRNSFLRPSVNATTEYCLALMIVFALLLNFWSLRLLSQKKNTLFLYLLFSSMEIVITALIEYILTIDVKLSGFPDNFIALHETQIKKHLFLNLLFRNCGLFCFAGLVSDNLRLRLQVQDKERTMYLKAQQLEVQQILDKESVLLSEDKICYITQNQNYNTFVTTEGKKYTKRGTLNDIYDLLGENHYVKISRSTIVRLKCINSIHNDIIELNMDQNTEAPHLQISPSFSSTAVPRITEFLKERNYEQSVSETSEPKPNHILQELPRKAQDIRLYIANHPNCKLSDIVSGTQIPKSTVTRYLKEMQDKGLIEYTGSKKTGGYRVKEVATKTPTSNKKVKKRESTQPL